MKEATSELNLTIIVVIAIGVLVAFFYYALWPSLNDNLQRNSKCGKAYCANPCGAGNNTCSNAIGKLVDCVYKDKKGNEYHMQCPWKG